jgi:hypothetical protein
MSKNSSSIIISAKDIRALKMIKKIITRLNLNLNGLTVLTEVGTNNYAYTPIIAALAGAEKVYAWTSDTKYGTAKKVVERCERIAKLAECIDNIEFAQNDKPISHIKKANIITNSGFLRPMNQSFLQNVDSNKSVIPLMYEEWELRETDIDIGACKELGIAVAGTWESHPDLGVFDASGPLAVKLALEAGFEVYRNNIMVWSEDDFGKVAKKAFENFGAESVLMTTSADVLKANLSKVDFVYFCDYKEERTLVGKGGLLSISELASLNSSVGLIHLYGQLDVALLETNGFSPHPPKNGRSSVMSETLAYLGPEPLFSLTAAGLKVGQSLLQGEQSTMVQKIC